MFQKAKTIIGFKVLEFSYAVEICEQSAADHEDADESSGTQIYYFILGRAVTWLRGFVKYF